MNLENNRILSKFRGNKGYVIASRRRSNLETKYYDIRLLRRFAPRNDN